MSFESDPKEEHRSNLKSSFELPNELEDKSPPIGCELENLKEEIMQRDVHNSDFCNFLCHGEDRFDMSKHPNLTITIVESFEPSSLAGGKEETNIHEEKCKSLQDNCSKEKGDAFR